VLLTAFVTAFVGLSLAVAASPVCISTDGDGNPGNSDSGKIDLFSQTEAAVAPIAAGTIFFVSLSTNFGTAPAADGLSAQLFSKDILTGELHLLSVPEDPATAGAEVGDDNTLAVSTAEDGASYAILSDAGNFMAPVFDSNPGSDVFLWSPGTNGLEILCASGLKGL